MRSVYLFIIAEFKRAFKRGILFKEGRILFP